MIDLKATIPSIRETPDGVRLVVTFHERGIILGMRSRPLPAITDTIRIAEQACLGYLPFIVDQ
jgi:hypothetical protein